MNPMLFSVAVLLVLSGAVKARASVRLGLGTPIFSLLELLVAVILAGLAMGATAGSAAGVWLAAAGVALLLGSSVHHAGVVRDRRRRREASEARRLEAFLRMTDVRDASSD